MGGRATEMGRSNKRGVRVRRTRGVRIGPVERLCAIALAAAFLFVLPGLATADEPDFITLGVGSFDVNDEERSAEFRAEYRSDLRIWKVYPFFGGAVNSDGGVYAYSGLALDIFMGRRIVLTPQAALVAYEDGDSKDLGGVFQFRTGGEIAFRFDDYSRLGLTFHHISNAGIHDDNPGANMAAIIYAIPLD